MSTKILNTQIKTILHGDVYHFSELHSLPVGANPTTYAHSLCTA